MHSLVRAVGVGAAVACAVLAPGPATAVDHHGGPVESHGLLHPIGTDATTTQWITLHRGSRTLRTLVIAPALAPHTSVPLLVFAHGWDNNPQGYVTILTAWASAGFLVVAPTSPGMAKGSPLESETAGNQDQLDDLPVVLTHLLAGHRTLTIDPTEIVYAGHSDGGNAIATLAFNPTLHDLRARAYLILSGQTVPQNDQWTGTNKSPAYIADSFNDEWGLWPSAVFFYNHAHSPKVLVGIGRGETHLPPWTIVSGFHHAIWESTVDFCRFAFTGAPGAKAAMRADLAVSGISTSMG